MIRTGEMGTETCPALCCPVLFSPVLSSPALPSPIFSCPVLSWPVLSSPLMSSSVPGECCTAWLPSSSFLLSLRHLIFPLLIHSFLPLFFHTPVLYSSSTPLIFLSPPLSNASSLHYFSLRPLSSSPLSLPFPLLRLSGTWRSFNEVYHTHNPSFASPIALSGIAFETYQKEKIRIVNSNRKNSRRGKGPIESIHDFSSPFTWELPKKP